MHAGLFWKGGQGLILTATDLIRDYLKNEYNIGIGFYRKYPDDLLMKVVFNIYKVLKILKDSGFISDCGGLNINLKIKTKDIDNGSCGAFLRIGNIIRLNIGVNTRPKRIQEVVCHEFYHWLDYNKNKDLFKSQHHRTGKGDYEHILEFKKTKKHIKGTFGTHAALNPLEFKAYYFSYNIIGIPFLPPPSIDFEDLYLKLGGIIFNIERN